MNRILLTGYVAGPPSRAAVTAPIPAPTVLLLSVPRHGTDATDWIGVTVIGSAADVAAGLPVGTPVAIEGYLHSTSPPGGWHRLEVLATALTTDPPFDPSDSPEVQT